MLSTGELETLRQGQTPHSVAVATTLEATTAFTTSGKVVRAGLPDLDRPLNVGDVVGGRYEIRRALGHGGCGYVYEVYDRELEVVVALKTLRPDLRLAPEAIAQLKREIQLARRVTHANICRIFDVGFHDEGGRNTPFLTMEMIEGRSLADRLLDDPPLSEPELEAITRQLIAGLQAAHRAGVVHADLKPGNIMLDESRDPVRVVITDFGLATAQAIDLKPEGYILGTPAYMAPEQVEGKSLSPATDYYALGCTLYHAATGDVPFREKGPYATAIARLERAPPPPRERAEVSATWDQLISGLLAREPSARFDGADVLGALAPPRSKLGALSLLLVAAGLAVVVGAFAWNGRAGEPGPLVLSMPADAQAAEALAEAEELLAAQSAAAAIAELKRALARSPDHPRIHAALATAYDSHRPELAHSYIERAMELSEGRGDEHDFYRALYLLDSGDFAEATSLLTELDVRRPDTFEIRINLARSYQKSRAPELAAEVLAGLEPRTDGERLMVLYMRASVEYERMRFGEARPLGVELREHARKLGRPTAVARAEILLSQSLRQLNDLDAAAESGRASLEAAHEAGDPWLIADAHSTLISIFMARHFYAEALANLAGREAALAQVGMDREIVKLGITRAEILAETGRTKEALAQLDGVSIPGLRRMASVYWEGYAVLVRAELRRLRGDLERALDDCNAGLAIFRGLGNARLAAFGRTLCANALTDKGDLDEAAQSLDKAMADRTKLELPALVAQNWIDRGELALARGNIDDAALEADRAATYFERAKVRNDEAQALELAARARWRAGDLSGARAAITRARQIVEGESAPLNHAIAITRQVLEPSAEASERIDKHIAELRRGGYRGLSLEATMARAAVERAIGNADRAAELERQARADANRLGIVLYRYAAAAQ